MESPADINSTSPAADQKATDASSPEKHLHRSFGNKAFDVIVWPVVMGGAVWALSYLIAKEGTPGVGTNKNFEWLRKGTGRFTDWLAKKIETPVNTRFAQKVWKASPQEWAKAWATWGLVSIPGTALTPVTQVIERYRKPVSEHIDHVFHKTPDDPDNIKPEPKQTMYSMLAGRGVVVLGAATTMLGFGPKGMDAAGKAVGSTSAKLYKLIRPGADISENSTFRKNANIAVFDMILTLGAAAVMYGYSRRVARKQEARRHEHDTAAEKEQTLINSAAAALGDSVPDAATQDKKASFAARAGDRPEDFRTMAQKEPASSGIALS